MASQTSQSGAFSAFETQMSQKRTKFIVAKDEMKLQLLNRELDDVRDVLTKTVEEVIGRGEKLQSLWTSLSLSLSLARSYQLFP